MTGQAHGPLIDDGARAALEIDRSSSAWERTIDITTTGRRSGRARRIETWLYRTDGRLYLSGLPGRRDWAANLQAHPALTLHVKHGARADLAATARPVVDPQERRRIFSEFVDDMNQAHNPSRIVQPTRLEDWLAGSPLFEVLLDD